MTFVYVIHSLVYCSLAYAACCLILCALALNAGHVHLLRV